MYSLQKNTEALLQADLKLNTEEIKCIIICSHHNAGQNRNLLIDLYPSFFWPD